MQELAEKCLIDVEIRNGFEAGKIPIGETVDYTELYIREIIRNLNIMITNTEKAANTAYNEESKDDLYDLPPQIECGKCEAVNLTEEVCTLNQDTGEEECECVDCGCRCLECGCCQIVEKNALPLTVALAAVALQKVIKESPLPVAVAPTVPVMKIHALPVVVNVPLTVVLVKKMMKISVSVNTAAAVPA